MTLKELLLPNVIRREAIARRVLNEKQELQGLMNSVLEAHRVERAASNSHISILNRKIAELQKEIERLTSNNNGQRHEQVAPQKIEAEETLTVKLKRKLTVEQ